MSCLRGVVLLGHGSRVSGFDEVMEFHRERIQRLGIFGEVRIAYASTEPGLKEVVEDMDSGEIYIVPLFISHGAHTEESPKILGIEGKKGVFKGKSIFICNPIGKDGLITYAILNSVIEANLIRDEDLYS